MYIRIYNTVLVQYNDDNNNRKESEGIERKVIKRGIIIYTRARARVWRDKGGGNDFGPAERADIFRKSKQNNK